ncbi:MAG: N-acetylglucosamine-6-phosphate deacetylase [Roseburia sp.]|nr:N-acetylglucosamine-6-phosphate deacetylase [Roseburia sp.]MCM1098253.1 N-acetylglucosamine-6-phosphate deacetylase [Ruminococcus flavefaciens]
MKQTLFQNARIILPDRVLERGNLLTEGDRIRAIWTDGAERVTEETESSWADGERRREETESSRADGERRAEGAEISREAEIVDLRGQYLAPGFIDIHVHGGGGGDFMDAERESWQQAMTAHLRHGTTAMCPTTLTASPEEMERVFSLYREMEREERETGPRLLGLHMEGPYITESMKGAQNAAYIRRPEKGLTEWLLEKSRGALRILTMAPELEGAGEAARMAREAGILLSAGHSDGRLEDVEQAVRDGYTMATHLYSSMSTIIRENGMRRPGVLEAALLLDELDVEVIGDGMHLPPSLLKLIVKTKGPERMILVTDAMRAAGLGSGYYKLGSRKEGQTVWSDGKVARMPDGISFAGSIATADRLIRVMHEEAEVPVWQAVAMMTKNPARALGETEIGVLAPGKKADLVAFDEKIRISRVYRDGVAQVIAEDNADKV